MDGLMKRGVVALMLMMLFSFAACTGDKSELRLITVTGEAEVRVPPDEAILTVSVETFDKDLGIATKQNDERMKKVLALAKKYKIDPKYIQTGRISIEPRYKDGYTREDFIGFFVRKTIVFTVKDISRLKDLLSGALAIGANYVHEVQLQTTKLREYREQARVLALKDAKEKAKNMARELGQRVGKPYSIVEEQGEGGMAANVIKETGGSPREIDASIALGLISVKARVRVSFELR
jgi:uncharacterized protein YggE